MTDQLKASYADLQAAASAMTAAGARVAKALGDLQGEGHLSADAFGSKGDKLAEWYTPNQSNAVAAVKASHTSFDELATALRKAAAVYALVDARLREKASD